VLVSDFDYPLPKDLIAQQPLADRAASRMLHLDRGAGGGGAVRDRAFRDLPELLRPSDLLVVNNSRVFAARLYGRRAGVAAQPISPRNPAAKDFLRGRIEVLLTQPLPAALGQLTKRQSNLPPLLWQALVRPGRKINVGERLYFGDLLQAEVVARGQFGERTLQFSLQQENAAALDFFALLESLGHTPLPPYIARPDSIADRERYQTVYARHPGSVAAPTAGLHFTPEILAGLRSRGIEIAEITLHVGLGTFQPVRVTEVEAHRMHRERFSISPAAAQQINRARADRRRVVAVGTTTVRTLEFCVAQNAAGEIAAGDGEADLFIFPGYKFRVGGALLTNFHLPQSTLLMLVCAFAGRDPVLAAYHHAVEQRYRFFSYGDCMFIE
jgi:S-adenosylmethionine:tRNA ribosyltransferase-isomerase